MEKRTLTAAGLQIQLYGAAPYEFTWNKGRAVGIGSFAAAEDEKWSLLEAISYLEGMGAVN